MRVFWRVEMWCRRQAAAAVLPLLLTGWLTGESSEALTTFGKSNTEAPKNTAPTAPPGEQNTKHITNFSFFTYFLIKLFTHWTLTFKIIVPCVIIYSVSVSFDSFLSVECSLNLKLRLIFFSPFYYRLLLF
jgi:hypothetical protein